MVILMKKLTAFYIKHDINMEIKNKNTTQIKYLYTVISQGKHKIMGGKIVPQPCINTAAYFLFPHWGLD